jgi:hypothetical protein
VNQEAPLGRAPIFGKDGSDPYLLLFAQNRNGGSAVRISKGQINLVFTLIDNFLYLIAETKREVIQERKLCRTH